MKTLHPRLLPALLTLTALSATPRADAAPFTPGNLAVVRLGDVVPALSAIAAPVFIDEYTTAGALVQSIAIPSVAGSPMLTMAGSATSEGGLMRSPNGAVLCFGGYGAAAGTAALAATTAAAAPREAGTVNAAGTFAVAANTLTQHSGANIRSAAADGMGNFWSGGTGSPTSNGGVNYLGTSSAAAQLLSGNLRWVNIFNGSLYFSSGAAVPGLGVHQFTGKPVAAVASAPVVIGAAGSSPYGFSLSPAGTVMYVADDRNIASGGGIQRWNKAGAVWTLAYTLGTGAASTVGSRGLTVNWSGANPVIFATTTETLNRLITVTDTGVGSVATTLATVTQNRAFRGVAFAPQQVPTPRFFTGNVLPPPNGVDVSTGLVYSNPAFGVFARNFSSKSFSQSFSPPPVGGSQVNSFASTVEVDVSANGGASFDHAVIPATISQRVTWAASDGNFTYYDTEMLQLNLQGGSLPIGVLVRESPTKQSTGRTSIETVPGGSMIGSFFDVFLDLSADNGQTWIPSAASGRLDLGVDSTIILPVKAPTNLWPPRSDFFAGTAVNDAVFPGGVVVRQMRHQFFTQSQVLPALGAVQVQNFDSQMDMAFSTNGGATFQPVRASAAVTVQVRHSRDEGGTQIFDTEMLALNLSGGGLPGGFLIRESPTKQSTGGAYSRPPAAGDPDPDLLRIGSFFDVFVELSIDGGATWTASTVAPAHHELQCLAPEVVESSSNLPPVADRYLSTAGGQAAFTGIVIREVKLDHFTQAMPPPPPGGSQVQATGATVSFMISTNGGVSFAPGSAPASMSFNVASYVDQAATRYFDTEMLQLDISGGSLPAGVRLRESPSKASTGRTSIRQTAADYRISSFFDVFTELSVDGGATWAPTAAAPLKLVLEKSPPAPPSSVPHFFTSTNLPPLNGVIASSAEPAVTYLNGVIVKTLSLRQFTASQPPPPPGGTQVKSFSATAELDASFDGGASFSHVIAPASITTRTTDPGGGNAIYDTEMLQLDLTGTGPFGPFMIRESPTKQSTGKTTIQVVTGGYMIDSFFDVFTELSIDGGASWSPAPAATHVDLSPDPLLIAPVPTPRPLLPPPNDFFASTADAQFSPGVVIRNVKHHLFTQSQTPPAAQGQSQIQSFDSQVDLEITPPTGGPFQRMRAPASVVTQVTHSRNTGTTQVYDTEMLQLNISGGGLPAGVMLRESPTLKSTGGTAITPQPTTGTFRIQSFFDVFLEMSIDGGASWNPATGGPLHLDLFCNAPEAPETSPNLLPVAAECVCQPGYHVTFAQGSIFKEVSLDHFTQSQPPPPPGGSQVQAFGAVFRYRLSTDGGKTYQPGTAPAQVTMQVSSSLDDGDTRYFDTEMLALSIAGPGPPFFMVRESPTLASLGRISSRQVAGNYHISSFFDIFTELSIDGGATWHPTTSGEAELILRNPVIIPDTDGDGMPDTWELVHFGPGGALPGQDADQDGRTNREEFTEGTDPNNPLSGFQSSLTRLAANAKFHFDAVPGRRYSLEYSQDMAPGTPWLPYCTDLEGSGPTDIMFLEAFTSHRLFFRFGVEVIPP